MAVNATSVLYLLAAAMFGLGTFLILRHRMLVRSSLRVRGRTLQPALRSSRAVCTPQGLSTKSQAIAT